MEIEGKICELEQLVKDVAQLSLSSDFSDVTFIVQNERISAHRLILAARNEYFRAILYGGLEESQQKEVSLNIPLQPFKWLLQFLYSGKLTLSDMKEDVILETLGLAHEYGVTVVTEGISDYLREIISVGNVCAVLDAARLYNLEELSSTCLLFIDGNASQVLKHTSFRAVSFDSLCELLDRDTLSTTSEETIFRAVHEWCNHNVSGAHKADVLYGKVRFTLISQEGLLNVVRPTGVLDAERLLDIIVERNSSDLLPHRAKLYAGVNSTEEATYEYGDWDDGRHSCTIDLGEVVIINEIELDISDIKDYEDTDELKECLHTSVDGINWMLISERYVAKCPHFYFFQRAVRWIRIIGSVDEQISNLDIRVAMFNPKSCKQECSNLKSLPDCRMEIEGEIGESVQPFEDVLQLCLPDVTFVVQNERIPAHRHVLAAKNAYFRALLEERQDDNQQLEITLAIPLEAFKCLLRFLYSGKLTLSGMKEEVILDMLGLAHKYGVTAVTKTTSTHLGKMISTGNVCAILDTARMCNLSDLSSTCLLFIDGNASQVLKHESFHTVSFDSLCDLLDRSSLCSNEETIFLAVHKWSKHDVSDAKNVDVLYGKVRFTLISRKGLLNVVRPTGVLDSERLLDIMAKKESSDLLPYRAQLCKSCD
uniref:BTB domain-containing protein n=1 Tax=Anopheles dirus TaxID=7168 RepID=A0A182N7P8_9DIPT